MPHATPSTQAAEAAFRKAQTSEVEAKRLQANLSDHEKQHEADTMKIEAAITQARHDQAVATADLNKLRKSDPGSTKYRETLTAQHAAAAAVVDLSARLVEMNADLAKARAAMAAATAEQAAAQKAAKVAAIDAKMVQLEAKLDGNCPAFAAVQAAGIVELQKLCAEANLLEGKQPTETRAPGKHKWHTQTVGNELVVTGFVLRERDQKLCALRQTDPKRAARFAMGDLSAWDEK